MQYIPKKKKSNKIVISALLITVISACLIYINRPTEAAEEYTPVCAVNDQNAIKTLNKKETGIGINDYLFYGENLNIFKDKYNPEVADALASKTLVVQNVCSGEEQIYILENKRDKHIPLYNLEEGVYLFYLQENAQRQLITSDIEINDSLELIKRANSNKQVSVYSNTQLLNNSNIEASNKLVLKVEEKSTSEDYDIVIDPLLYNTDFTPSIWFGSKTDEGFVHELNYNFATALAKSLEAQGLDVLVTRDSDEHFINTYGEEGRLAKAYASGAKYYIAIDFTDMMPINIHGASIIHSYYASDNLGSTLMYEMMNNANIEPSNYYYNNGVASESLVNGIDERLIYGNNMYLRESGGYATNAGAYSESSIDGTAAFSFENRKGMHSILISPGYASYPEDVAQVVANQQQIVDVIAQGLVKYLKVN